VSKGKAGMDGNTQPLPMEIDRKEYKISNFTVVAVELSDGSRIVEGSGFEKTIELLDNPNPISTEDISKLIELLEWCGHDRLARE
jgi:hypothetical protein